MKFLDEIRIKKLFTIQRGTALVVLRPRDAELALRQTKEILAKQSDGTWDAERVSQEFNNILGEQEYKFLGFMGSYKGGLTRILDERGEIVGTMQPGDSFVSAEWSGSGKDLRPIPPAYIVKGAV